MKNSNCRLIDLEELQSENFTKTQIQPNKIIGFVSADLKIRKKIKKIFLDAYMKNLYGKWVERISNLESLVVLKGETVIENFRLKNPLLDEYTSFGLLEFVGIEDVFRNISELSIYERKKLQMIEALASRSDIVILDDLYEELSHNERKEIDEVLVEYSLQKSIILTASTTNIIENISEMIFVIGHKG